MRIDGSKAKRRPGSDADAIEEEYEVQRAVNKDGCFSYFAISPGDKIIGNKASAFCGFQSRE